MTRSMPRMMPTLVATSVSKSSLRSLQQAQRRSTRWPSPSAARRSARPCRRRTRPGHRTRARARGQSCRSWRCARGPAGSTYSAVARLTLRKDHFVLGDLLLFQQARDFGQLARRPARRRGPSSAVVRQHAFAWAFLRILLAGALAAQTAQQSAATSGLSQPCDRRARPYSGRAFEPTWIRRGPAVGRAFRWPCCTAAPPLLMTSGSPRLAAL